MILTVSFISDFAYLSFLTVTWFFKGQYFCLLINYTFFLFIISWIAYFILIISFLVLALDFMFVFSLIWEFNSVFFLHIYWYTCLRLWILLWSLLMHYVFYGSSKILMSSIFIIIFLEILLFWLIGSYLPFPQDMFNKYFFF